MLYILFPVGFVAIVVSIAKPNFIGSETSKRNHIINNLRQIEGAKCQWAFDHGITNEPFPRRVLTAKDLDRYLFRSFETGREFGNPKYGELYFIRDLDQPCEAVLTRDVNERNGAFTLPRGSIMRLAQQTNGLYEIVFPDGTVTIYGYDLPNGQMIVTNR